VSPLIGIFIALRSRDASGLRQFVDVSMLDSMISTMTSNFMIYLGSGSVPDPLGTSYPSIVPYRTFPTLDTDLAIAVGSEKLWRGFGAAIGHANWPIVRISPQTVCGLRTGSSSSLSWQTLSLRTPWRIGRDKLRAAGIPASPIRRFDEVVNDPQCAVREMFPNMRVPDLRTLGEWVPDKIPGTVSSCFVQCSGARSTHQGNSVGLVPDGCNRIDSPANRRRNLPSGRRIPATEGFLVSLWGYASARSSS